MNRNISFGILIVLGFTGLSGGAFAHSGGALPSPSFITGALHVLSGFDHILAMLAVGIWSSRHGARIERWMPVVFVVATVHGAVMASSGQALPAAEIGTAASVTILGLLLAASLTLRLPVAFFLVAVFAVFHGFSHAESFADDVNYADAGFGALAATVALQAVGICLGRQIEKHQLPVLARGVGIGCIIAGIVLLAS
ncbi:MAG TPA: sodium:proton antiporter [Rhodospirillaceae bacterium]|nr:sodium:proton antiporter [Rhodospirillaceae bacterium]HAA92748.1 sodium:proton antiporter [Rhodospirillaceae bacterium]HAT34393.1 sodium:proton antiporter [Rhodospirillaceae bacterium]|tara:strand:+ start:291 stop:881 length:591 start_codon:yes stop_codon:yes gene_type:complete